MTYPNISVKGFYFRVSRSFYSFNMLFMKSGAIYVRIQIVQILSQGEMQRKLRTRQENTLLRYLGKKEPKENGLLHNSYFFFIRRNSFFYYEGCSPIAVFCKIHFAFTLCAFSLFPRLFTFNFSSITTLVIWNSFSKKLRRNFPPYSFNYLTFLQTNRYKFRHLESFFHSGDELISVLKGVSIPLHFPPICIYKSLSTNTRPYVWKLDTLMFQFFGFVLCVLSLVPYNHIHPASFTRIRPDLISPTSY